MGLPTDDPLHTLAMSIIEGDHDPAVLAAAIEAWPTIADKNPHVAGVAWLLTGGSFSRQVEAVTAETEPPTEAEDVMAAISRRLNDIQRVGRNQIQSAMDVATRAAVDRIGRVATQKVKATHVKDRCRQVAPRLAVATMGPIVFAALELNEQNRVRTALSEGVAVVEQTLRDRTSEAVNVVAGQFAVDFDPDPYLEFRQPALDYLQQHATDWAIERLHNPNATSPDRFPSDIVLSTLQVAGGVEPPAGRMPQRTGGLQPSLTTGPVFQTMIADVLDAYRDAPELAEARDAS